MPAVFPPVLRCISRPAADFLFCGVCFFPCGGFLALRCVYPKRLMPLPCPCPCPLLCRHPELISGSAVSIAAKYRKKSGITAKIKSKIHSAPNQTEQGRLSRKAKITSTTHPVLTDILPKNLPDTPFNPPKRLLKRLAIPKI